MYYSLCVLCACCLAESSCSCQLDWLGCPRAAAHQVEALTAGHCRPRVFSSNFANGASPPPVLTSTLCTEVPAWHSLAGGDEQGRVARSPWPSSAAGMSVVHGARAAPGGTHTTSAAAKVWCNE